MSAARALPGRPARRARWLFAALAALAAAGCGSRLSETEAERLVRRYNEVVSEAYRTGDEARLPEVAGPAEASKVGATIGVKRDLGLTLDARLLELAVAGTSREGREVRVRTHERWWYQDLRLGSGERVGRDSSDTYELVYRLQRFETGWRVAAVDFAAPPRVGREVLPPAVDPRILHGIAPTDPSQGDPLPAEPRPPARAPSGAPERRP